MEGQLDSNQRPPAPKAVAHYNPRCKVVGAEGFEPPTLWSQTRCATRLRYAPTPCDYPMAGLGHHHTCSSRGSGLGVLAFDRLRPGAAGWTQLLACSFGVRTGTLDFGVRASLSPPCGRFQQPRLRHPRRDRGMHQRRRRREQVGGVEEGATDGAVGGGGEVDLAQCSRLTRSNPRGPFAGDAFVTRNRRRRRSSTGPSTMRPAALKNGFQSSVERRRLARGLQGQRLQAWRRSCPGRRSG